MTSYAEYTCKVTNEVGSANVTAYIYAITGMTEIQFIQINIIMI